MNWIFDMFNGKDDIKKEADLTNQEKEWERKVETNDWIKDAMEIDETTLEREAAEKQAAEEEVAGVAEPFDEVGMIMAFEQGELGAEDVIKLFSELVKNGHAWSLQGSYGRAAKSLIDQGYLDEQGNILKYPGEEVEGSAHTAEFVSTLKKTAAFDKGDTCEETIGKDYELKVKGLSDYNLAEMLSEYAALDKGVATLSHNEYKEDALKEVKSGRDAAEKKLLKLLGDHTLIDWKKSFKEMEESEVKHAAEKDLYAEWKEGKMAWESKTKFDATSDKEKLEQMDGVGKEEEKGQVGKEATLELEHNHDTKDFPYSAGCHACIIEEKRKQIEEKKKKEAAKKLKCPKCGKSESVTPAHDNKLNKCDACHYAFDNESAKNASLNKEAASPAEMVEKKVKELIKDKIEEAFAEAPATKPEDFPKDPLMVGEGTPEDVMMDKMKVPHLEPGETPESEMKEWEEMEETGKHPDDKREPVKVEEVEDKPEEKDEDKEASLKSAEYQPKTGEPCSCKPGIERDNCPSCEGTGMKIDFKKIREKSAAPADSLPDVTPSVTPVDAPADERGYHGWRNFETYMVALWIDNDHGLYDAVVEMARSAADLGDLAMQIKSLVEENEPDLGATVYADLLNSAMSDVDWSEVADHYSEDMAPEAPELAEPAAETAPGVEPEGASLKEIQPAASKKEVLQKIAEIDSPWKVLKNEKGEEIVARVAPTMTEKKSKEKDNQRGINSQDLK